MKLKIVGALITMAMASTSYSGGVQLSKTRILFKDGETQASYGLTNHAETPILASAIISNFDGSPSEAFAVSPSLYQVQPKKTHQGQIVLLSPLPKDRESVFWLPKIPLLASVQRSGFFVERYHASAADAVV